MSIRGGSPGSRSNHGLLTQCHCSRRLRRQVSFGKGTLGFTVNDEPERECKIPLGRSHPNEAWENGDSKDEKQRRRMPK